MDIFVTCFYMDLMVHLIVYLEDELISITIIFTLMFIDEFHFRYTSYMLYRLEYYHKVEVLEKKCQIPYANVLNVIASVMLPYFFFFIYTYDHSTAP